MKSKAQPVDQTPAPPPTIAMPDAVRRPITNLQPVEYNPRTDEAPGLGDSLRGFGFLQPLIVNTYPGREGRIVGGEKRWRELRAEGIDEAPIIEVYLELEREKELNIRLNRNQAEWDWGKLEEFFDRSALQGWGFQAWEFGEIPPAADTNTNHQAGPSHDTRSYMGSTIKKFEVLVPVADYERVAAGIARVAEERGLKTNTDVFLALLEPFMPAAPASAAGESDGDAGAHAQAN
jgi:hypothetical protein